MDNRRETAGVEVRSTGQKTVYSLVYSPYESEQSRDTFYV